MLVPTKQLIDGGSAVQPIDSGGPSTSSSSEDIQNVSGHGDLPPLPDSPTAQLDPGKQALRELLKDRKTQKKSKTSCASLLKLYTTILAGLMIIGGLFTLLFLVPMIIDPALATLTYDFHPTPVLCMTTFAEWVEGLKNITWCSCTEGCTSDVYNCSQITVVYRNCVEGNDSETRGFGCDVNSTVSSTNTSYIDPAHWDVLNASLFINVKGCGYPPVVNCSNFMDNFGVPGRRFWCYYSKMDPYLVMPEYDPQQAESDLILSLGWTVGAQALGIIIIAILHCPYVAFFKSLWRKRRTVLQPDPRGLGSESFGTSTTSLVAAFKDIKKGKHRQPVFQRDWYDVHT
ncbi:protein tipE-like isoform X2 [Penaeus monodon]|uniref:protein tipE-like isoform X2 n=1 Tax=Penaeus monodon TaxID=6687 RepID=UPI0018A72A9D|nr:protein tipE-like isoform X2 [Penaeus monodon]